MEKLINTNLVIHINYIKSIKISDERCVIYADTVDFGAIKMLFDDVWDCRYTIENGITYRNLKKPEIIAFQAYYLLREFKMSSKRFLIE